MTDTERSYAGPIVDCSVHNEIAQISDLVTYLPSDWQRYFHEWGVETSLDALLGSDYPRLGGADRDDARPGPGKPAGSDPEILSRHLATEQVQAIVLNHSRLLSLSTLPNPHLAEALARAANEWLVDRWFPIDKRFLGSIVIANQIPDHAAREIRRMSSETRMVQVAMGANGVGHPFGHPQFEPIYAAAAECGMPVAIHAGHHGGIHPPPTAGGRVSYFIEHEILSLQALMTALASLIAGGVLERFRDLRIVFQGGGVAWLPAFLWRYEANYKAVRREVPWARRRPTDYFRSQIRVSTESLEYSVAGDELIAALDDVGGRDTLVFSSDYPDSDQPPRPPILLRGSPARGLTKYSRAPLFLPFLALPFEAYPREASDRVLRAYR